MHASLHAYKEEEGSKINYNRHNEVRRLREINPKPYIIKPIHPYCGDVVGPLTEMAVNLGGGGEVRVYNHYVLRKGLSMPYTEKVLYKTRPEGFDRDQPAFGTFLFYGVGVEKH